MKSNRIPAAGAGDATADIAWRLKNLCLGNLLKDVSFKAYGGKCSASAVSSVPDGRS